LGQSLGKVELRRPDDVAELVDQVGSSLLCFLETGTQLRMTRKVALRQCGTLGLLLKVPGLQRGKWTEACAWSRRKYVRPRGVLRRVGPSAQRVDRVNPRLQTSNTCADLSEGQVIGV